MHAPCRHCAARQRVTRPTISGRGAGQHCHSHACWPSQPLPCPRALTHPPSTSARTYGWLLYMFCSRHAWGTFGAVVRAHASTPRTTRHAAGCKTLAAPPADLLQKGGPQVVVPQRPRHAVAPAEARQGAAERSGFGSGTTAGTQSCRAVAVQTGQRFWEHASCMCSLEAQGVGGALARAKQQGGGRDPGAELEVLVLQGTSGTASVWLFSCSPQAPPKQQPAVHPRWRCCKSSSHRAPARAPPGLCPRKLAL